MTELLERADPATGTRVDPIRLRALVDERIGSANPVTNRPTVRTRQWLVGVAAFAVVLIVAVPSLLFEDQSGRLFPDSLGALNSATTGTSDLPGVEAVVPLASGGVQTMAIDGETIWVVTALQRELQQVAAKSGLVVGTYDIDAHVEGVVVGGGYVWLASYERGGEILRFDPASGEVDRRIPLGSEPGFARWFGDRLFVSNDQSELYEIDPDGEIVATHVGSLKGDGLGYLWLWDPSDGSIRSMVPNGLSGEIVIAADGAIAGDLSEVRSVGEAGGYLWLIFGDAGTSIVRFDPANGELLPLSVGRSIHSMVEHDGALWIASHTDHVLIQVDPETGEFHRYPVSGKPGGLVSSDGDLWVALFHPGQLVRMDTDEGLIETPTEVVSSLTGQVPDPRHVLSCTLGGVSDETIQQVTVDRDFSGLGPTILLEPNPWLDYGVWSVVQAELSNAGNLVCTHGYLDGDATPEQRAADLESSLAANGIPGPYVLVAAADGVHALRLFADGRDDVAGVVLVDPMPTGFGSFYDGLVAEGGHPPWADLDPAVAGTLGGFGETPLVVLAQDPNAIFEHPDYVAAVGREVAEAGNIYWQEGIAYYAGLSADSRVLVATGSAFESIVWDRSDLVIDSILSVIPDR